MTQGHNTYICTSGCGLDGFFQRLAFYFNLLGKPSSRFGLDYCLGNTSCGPNMIVLEHDHLAEIQSVSGSSSHQEAIFFHHTKARCRFARPCHVSLPSQGPGASDCDVRERRDAAAPTESIQGRAFALQESVDRTRNDSETNGVVARRVLQVIALLVVVAPPDGASQFIKDGLAEGLARENAGALEKQFGFLDGIANDQAANVETGHVVVEPGADRGLDLRLGQEVMKVGAAVTCHDRGG
jgi:hypothetical protein